MTLKQRCQAGEAKLDQVSAALLDPRPEVLDRCEADLEEIIAMLETGDAESIVGPSADKADLLRLRNRIRLWPCRRNRQPIYAKAGLSWA